MNLLRGKKQVLSLLTAVLASSGFLSTLAANAAEEIVLSAPVGGAAAKAPLQSSVAVTMPGNYTLPPSQKDLKQAPVTVEIYQNDETPIGNRHPLLMVHGLRGEFREGFRWEKVVERLMKDPDFRQKYKIYFARFNTYTLVSTVKPHFKRAVVDLYRSTGNKQLTVMALSLGGNLVQESMEDVDVHSSIEKVLTLGTPFHGAPLFCFDWLRYSIVKNHDVPWVRADLCLSYKMYFARHPNLLEDLRWDNSDNGIPHVGKWSTWFPFHVTGEVDVSKMANARILKVNESIKLDKKKFICYGGYLLTPYVTPHQSNRFWKAVKWPYWFATCTVPYHLGFEHPVLRALNYEMGRMPVLGEGGKDLIMGSGRYGLNDGITPLVSALFLPNEVLAKHPVSREPTISTIRRNIDVAKARVFRQIDHITFVDGYRPAHLPKPMRDELAPELGAREIFDWILVDLMDSEGKLAKSEPVKGESNLDTDAVNVD